MSALRTIVRHVGANSLGYVVNVVVGIKLTPFVLERLGNSSWGLWSLIVSLVGYYGLFDAGIRSAVGHYVATYHARRDQALVNRAMSTAMALLLGVAAIALGATWLAAETIPDWLRMLDELRLAQGEDAAVAPDTVLSAQALAELETVVWIMGAGFALGLPMALFGTAVYSAHRIGIQNAIGISQVLLRAGLTVYVLERGWGMVGLAGVAIGCNVLGWIAAIVAAYRVLPGLSLAFRNATSSGARELFSYGGFNFLVNVADTVLLYTSSFVIVQWSAGLIARYALPPDTKITELVTYYALPATTLIPYFMQLVQAVTWAFTPYVTGRWATGQTEDVRRVLDVGTRGVLILASLIAGGLIFLGRDFLSVWCKHEFVSGPLFETSAQVLAILAVATLLRASQSTCRQVLFAMREVRYLGLLSLIEAIANVVLSIVLVRRFGLVGVAVATLIPVCVMQGFVQPRHLLRELQFDWRIYVWDSLRASLPVLLVMAGIDFVLGDRLAVVSDSTFVARGFVVAAPALLVGLYCGTNRQERRALFEKLRGK